MHDSQEEQQGRQQSPKASSRRLEAPLIETNDRTRELNSYISSFLSMHPTQFLFQLYCFLTNPECSNWIYYQNGTIFVPHPQRLEHDGILRRYFDKKECSFVWFRQYLTTVCGFVYKLERDRIVTGSPQLSNLPPHLWPCRLEHSQLQGCCVEAILNLMENSKERNSDDAKVDVAGSEETITAAVAAAATVTPNSQQQQKEEPVEGYFCRNAKALSSLPMKQHQQQEQIAQEKQQQQQLPQSAVKLEGHAQKQKEDTVQNQLHDLHVKNSKILESASVWSATLAPPLLQQTQTSLLPPTPAPQQPTQQQRQEDEDQEPQQHQHDLVEQSTVSHKRIEHHQQSATQCQSEEAIPRLNAQLQPVPIHLENPTVLASATALQITNAPPFLQQTPPIPKSVPQSPPESETQEQLYPEDDENLKQEQPPQQQQQQHEEDPLHQRSGEQLKESEQQQPNGLESHSALLRPREISQQQPQRPQAKNLKITKSGAVCFQHNPQTSSSSSSPPPQPDEDHKTQPLQQSIKQNDSLQQSSLQVDGCDQQPHNANESHLSQQQPSGNTQQQHQVSMPDLQLPEAYNRDVPEQRSRKVQRFILDSVNNPELLAKMEAALVQRECEEVQRLEQLQSQRKRLLAEREKEFDLAVKRRRDSLMQQQRQEREALIRKHVQQQDELWAQVRLQRNILQRERQQCKERQQRQVALLRAHQLKHREKLERLKILQVQAAQQEPGKREGREKDNRSNEAGHAQEIIEIDNDENDDGGRKYESDNSESELSPEIQELKMSAICI